MRPTERRRDGRQVNRLLGEALLDVAREEITSAIERRGTSRARAGVEIGNPTIHTRLEARIQHQVPIGRRRHALIRQRVRVVHRRTREALARD